MKVTLFNDPACPWGYAANPQFRVLEWRYGDQLEWRLVVIGLRENVAEMAARGLTPLQAAVTHTTFRRRYGMPYGISPKPRLAATGQGCRAIVAARIIEPGCEWRVLRALQFANFTTSLSLDDDDEIRDALRAVPGIPADVIADRLDDPEVDAAYERDRLEARSATGTPIDTQGKAATSDGLVRFTAPSLVFERNGSRLDAGGWQPILTYDTIVANLDPTIAVNPAPDSPAPLMDRFRHGLTTAEVAALLSTGPDPVADLDRAEQALLELAAEGTVVRLPLGHDALWISADATEPDAGAGVTSRTSLSRPLD